MSESENVPALEIGSKIKSQVEIMAHIAELNELLASDSTLNPEQIKDIKAEIETYRQMNNNL